MYSRAPEISVEGEPDPHSSTLSSTSTIAPPQVVTTPSSAPSSTPLPYRPPSTLTQSSSKAPAITPNVPTTLSSVTRSSSASLDISTNTPPKVSSSDKTLNTSPKYAVSSGTSSARYFPSAGMSGGTTTRMALPTFTASVGMIPPSASNSSNSTTSSACGQCSVMAEQVQVFYWPTASVKTDCARGSAITPFASTPTFAANTTTNVTKSLNAFGGDNSVEVIDGFTYTFPSMYISVVGKISVSNSCGVIGATHTNPTPVAVQAITTASYASWPSECRRQGDYVDVVIDTLDVADIACPTWGLSNPFTTTCDGDVYLTATEGPPYNPVILVPTQFIGYDPAWEICSKAQTNGPFVLPCGLYDPPKALHKASFMVPTTKPAADPPVTAVPQVAASPEVAQPTAIPAQAPQTVKAQVPQPVQTPANSAPEHPGVMSNDPKADPNQAASQDQGTSNNDPAAAPVPNTDQALSQGQTTSDNAPAAVPAAAPASDPHQPAPQDQTVPKNAPAAAPVTDTNQPPPQGDGISNNPAQGPNQAAPQGQGTTKGGNDPNQGTASNSAGQQPGNQAAPVAVDSHNPAPAPQPLPQTTIAISGANPSPAIGGIIHSAFGGNPGSAPGGNSGGTQGGSSGGNAAGGPGNGPGGSTGNIPNGNSGQGSDGIPMRSSGGVPGAAPGANPGGSPNTGTGAVGGSDGGTIEGAPGGTPGQNPGGNPGNPQANDLGGNAQQNPPAFTPHAVEALGQTLSAVNPSAVAIAGNTLSAGGPAFSTNGNFFSVGPSGNLVAGTLAANAASTPVLTVGGSAYTANSASQFVIAGQTLNPGAAITVSGTPISLASGASNIAVVGSSTQALSMITPAPAPHPALLTFDGSTYTANSASQFVVAGQTLSPGGSITVNGIPISEHPEGSFAMIGTSTQALQTPGMATVPALMTFDGQTYTANAASGFVIAGQTLTPGGVITVSGTPISQAPSGSGIVAIGSSTQVLGHAAAAAATITDSPTMTFGGQTYTANAASEFVIDGQTLTPGGVITVSGTPISEAASGSGLVAIGSSTQVLGHAHATITDAPTMTFGGQTYTANAASEFIIDGQTLTPGGVVTVSGTPISEAASGSGVVVIGSSTQTLGHASPSVTKAAVMTFNGQTFTANAAGTFLIDGQTLTPGGAITVSGTPISEAAGATDVVIGTSTQALSTSTSSPSAMTFIGGQMKLNVRDSAWLFGWSGLLMMVSGFLFA